MRRFGHFVVGPHPPAPSPKIWEKGCPERSDGGGEAFMERLDLVRSIAESSQNSNIDYLTGLWRKLRSKFEHGLTAAIKMAVETGDTDLVVQRFLRLQTQPA